MGIETHREISEPHAKRVSDRPRRRKNYVPRRVDQRRRSARRAKALREHYTAVLTAAGRQLSIELAAAVTKAAELVALVEDMRARALRGVEINADDLVRMERVSDTAVRRLALPATTSKPGSTLADLLRADHDRQMERVP